jgi:hypothetical protein
MPAAFLRATAAIGSCLARASHAERRELRLAVGAGAAQHDVVLGELVAAGARDLLQGLFETGVVEHLDASALVAHEVVVVLASGKGGLEARHAAAEVHAMNEAELGEALEDAVDARDPDFLAVSTEAVEELLRGDAAVLALEVGDDRLPGASRPRARAA